MYTKNGQDVTGTHAFITSASIDTNPVLVLGRHHYKKGGVDLAYIVVYPFGNRVKYFKRKKEIEVKRNNVVGTVVAMERCPCRCQGNEWQSKYSTPNGVSEFD